MIITPTAITVEEREKQLIIMCVAMESFHLPRIKRRTSRTTPTIIPIVSAVVEVEPEGILSAAGGVEEEGSLSAAGGMDAEGAAVVIPGVVPARGEGVTKMEGPVGVEDITLSGGDGGGFGSTVVAIVVLVYK